MGNFLSNEDEELSNIEEIKVEKKRKRKNRTIKRKMDVVEDDYDIPSNYNPFSNISFNRNEYEKDEEDLEEVQKPIYQKKKRKQSRKNVTFE
jgi:hypothetical protein